MSSAASGHVVPVPQLLATGAVTTMSFAVPNERPEPMSGVTVSFPLASASFARIQGGLGGDARRLDRDVAGRPARVSDGRDVPARCRVSAVQDR